MGSGSMFDSLRILRPAATKCLFSQAERVEGNAEEELMMLRPEFRSRPPPRGSVKRVVDLLENMPLSAHANTSKSNPSDRLQPLELSPPEAAPAELAGYTPATSSVSGGETVTTRSMLMGFAMPAWPPSEFVIAPSITLTTDKIAGSANRTVFNQYTAVDVGYIVDVVPQSHSVLQSAVQTCAKEAMIDKQRINWLEPERDWERLALRRSVPGPSGSTVVEVELADVYHNRRSIKGGGRARTGPYDL